MSKDKHPDRCVVTGGAGFIGSHIVAALLRRSNCEVTALDDLSSGRRENLDDVVGDSRGRSCAGRLRFIEGSILDDEAVDEAMFGASVVFHQAAIPSVPRSFADPRATLQANVEGTGCILEACRRHGVRRVVFASSSSVYGDTPTLPKKEDMSTRPMSPYALSKLAGEHLCEVFSRRYDIDTTALRYFNVFGPRQNPSSQYAAVVPKFICQMLDGERPLIYGDGKQSRDFTYVDNVVAANLLAAGMPVLATTDGVKLSSHSAHQVTPGNLVMNVGAGSRHTLLDLVEALNEALATELAPEFADPRPGDVRHSHADIESAARHVDYQPIVDFHEGLQRTIAWFRERQTVPSGPLAEF